MERYQCQNVLFPFGLQVAAGTADALNSIDPEEE